MKRFLLPALLCCVTANCAPPAIQLAQVIPLPGVEGRIDHFAVDLSGDRLFVCALENNSVEVLDLRKGERIKTIPNLGAPQGVAYAGEFDRLFVASDEGGLCRIFDGKSYESIGQINFTDDADNVRYDGVGKKIYVGFGSGGLGVISAKGKEVASIKLRAHPEAFALEQNGDRIFVNVPKSREVAVISRNEGKLVGSWKTGVASANFPIAIDENSRRVFVGCRSPARLIVLNTDTGEIVATAEISADVDDLFYDSKRHRIYAVCGAGKIDVIEQTGPDNYKVVSRVETAAGARTGLFVPERDRLVVAVPHRGSQQAELRVYHIE